MACVSLEHVTRIFRSPKGEVRAVDGVTLSVADREFVVLVGPSGCGKTTTLRLIAGLEEITEGTIRIGERVVNRVAPKDRDVAMVFQNYALYPHMTVFQNMAFGLKMRGVPKAEITRKVGDVATLLDLTRLLDRKPAALSGGERQRVAVGRAIVRKPQAFLFDEPLSNLDAPLRIHMRTELKRLQRDLQTTMIHVTHDQEEAMTLGDRIVILRDGIVQQCGPPLEVYHRPANRFVGGFIGTPLMNFFEGRLEGGNDPGAWGQFVGGIGRLNLAAATGVALGGQRDRPAVLGLRPQHIYLDPPGESGRQARLTPHIPPYQGGMTGGSPVVVGEASVRLIEPLGDSLNVHLATAAGESLVARVPPTVSVACGQRVTFRMDVSQAHLFAADESGRRLN